MFSERFQRTVRVTRHAQRRMRQRDVDETRLLDLIETGSSRFKDSEHGWVFKAYNERDDNHLCAAILLGPALIVKTVMHHFTPE